MIKFLGTDTKTGRQVVGFGLSRHNLELLQRDKPIRVIASEMDPSLKFDVVIFYGDTETSMQEACEKAGMIDSDTKINVDPRLKGEGS